MEPPRPLSMFLTVEAEMPLLSAATSRVTFKNSRRARNYSPIFFNISFLPPSNIAYLALLDAVSLAKAPPVVNG